MASEKKKLLMTMTGEIHQPVRLYYQVFDQAAVLHAFAKLRCLDEDQDNHRWVWLYHGGRCRIFPKYRNYIYCST